MPTRFANATWSGGLKTGKGNISLESNVWSGPYDHRSRFEKGDYTNPEELLGAAHAGCFTMFVSALLEKNGTPATKVETKADVTVLAGADGPTITEIVLTLVGEVPNITKEKFVEIAKEAKVKCPISKAVASVSSIKLDITLK